MNETQAISQFGLLPEEIHRTDIRELLLGELSKTTHEGNQDLMRVLCVQLFALGAVEDSLLIWSAKFWNFDTASLIDIQFLCGAGLEKTKEFLAATGTKVALDALGYLLECEQCGDFERFSSQQLLEETRACYSRLFSL